MVTANWLLRSLLAIGLLVSVGVGWAAGAAHEHGHGAMPALVLDHGHPWPTDASLRTGMSNMRVAMAAALPAIHGDKFTVDQYVALAAKLQVEAGYIVANCRLDEAADAQLHLVLAQLLDGVGQMKVADSAARAREGAVKVVAALNNYGNFFKHPGWQALGD